jgi:hypothetical protein
MIGGYLNRLRGRYQIRDPEFTLHHVEQPNGLEIQVDVKIPVIILPRVGGAFQFRGKTTLPDSLRTYAITSQDGVIDLNTGSLNLFGEKPIQLDDLGVLQMQGYNPMERITMRYLALQELKKMDLDLKGEVFGYVRDTIVPELQVVSLSLGKKIGEHAPSKKEKVVQGLRLV